METNKYKISHGIIIDSTITTMGKPTTMGMPT
jgi:hypothetical protein